MRKVICKEERICTGCTACASACHLKCITMQANDEGFLYPHVDENLCINCGNCERVCPVNHPIETHGVLAGYVARYNDPSVVDSSTSGGSFSAFADYTFSKDGILFGVGYDRNMKVRHFSIDHSNREKVIEMRGSKYVQSDLGNSFQNVKDALLENRTVCFSGTPCQVAGLKSYLGKDYDNLITVDLVCHGVASPLVFEKYVEFQKLIHKSNPIDIKFRNKTYGYHSGTMMIEFENGKKYYGSGRIDYMLKAYFKGACSRYSCYDCPYKTMERCSDFTIFDSWNIEKLVPEMKDDDRGYTNIFVHTEKGQKILDEIKNYLFLMETNVGMMKTLDGVMIEKNPKQHPSRGELIKRLNTAAFKDQMQKYLPVTPKDYLVERIKGFLFSSGMMRALKSIKERL